MESSHVSALQTKHAGLERRLHDEMKSPHPDMGMITMLKRHKLRIRDQLAQH
jgi:hypothetical protein